MPAPQHFITGAELDADRLSLLLHRAAALKAAPLSSRALEGRTVALVFNKPSTRTRTSFESGVFEMGGHPMILRPDEMQLTRGESVRDTAYILSRHSALIGLRTGNEDELNGLAEHASVPVVNMLSPGHHPCQALADLLTLKEALGALEGRVDHLRRRRQQRRPLAGRRGRDRGPGGAHRRARGLPDHGHARASCSTTPSRPSRAPTPSTPTCG